MAEELTTSCTGCDCDACDNQRPAIGLDDWRVAMRGLRPHPFWQLGQQSANYVNSPIGYPAEAAGDCDKFTYQYHWQGNQQSGRWDIWMQIVDAEKQFYEYTGFWPSARFGCAEVRFDRPHRYGPIALPAKKIKQIGRERFVMVEAVIVADTDIFDSDGDGIADKFIVCVDWPTDASGTAIPVGELHLFHPAASWVDSRQKWFYEVRPVRFTANSSGKLCIEGPAWLLVKPGLYEGYGQGVLDVMDKTVFEQSLELYRQWVDPTGAVTLLRKPQHECHCGCTGDYDDSCLRCTPGQACVVNAEVGIIELRWSQIACACQQCVDGICIHYYGGDCGWESKLAHLVAANLAENVCQCGNPEVTRWQEEYISPDSRNRLTTVLSFTELQNLFGTKRGQLEMYRALRIHRRIDAARL